MVCPSDDSLRHLLHNAEQETSSTDVLSHLAGCPACMDRVSTWNEQSRLDTLLRGAGQSDIAIARASRVIIPGDVEALTCAYAPGTAPLRMIGQYEILRPIGSGGGGDVFEARHTLLQNRVAIKLLKPKHSGDQDARQRFFREMKSIGQLDDPYIVRAFDAGEADGTLYLAMELVDGENVDNLARRLAPMPVADACEIIRQAALGLQHVHECGLVHRDLKPSNLLMSKTGIKIADLGLALLKRGELIEERLTGVHTVLGTADYMAPEQAEGSHEVDIRADLYSLGCTLFRLLTGRTPFAMPENSSPVKKMWAHASLPIPEIQQFRPDVPPELAAVVKKLMAKNRNDRFAQPKDLAEALAPFCLKPDLPSMMLPLGTIAPAVFGNNSTAKNPTEPLASPSAASQGTVVQSPSLPLRRFAGIAAGIVSCALLAVGWWWVRDTTEPVPPGGPQNHQLAVAANVTPQTPPVAEPPKNPILDDKKNPVPQVADNLPPAIAVPLGPIGQRWQKAFGLVPIELKWGDRSGMGTWRLDEDVQALVIQAHKTIRLVKLGEFRRGDQGFTLGCDVIHQSNDGELGVFLGFQREDKDNPRFARFQAIAISALPSSPKGKIAIVRRNIREINLHSGQVNHDRNHNMIMDVPNGLKTLPFEIRMTGGYVDRVLFCGESCFELCSPARSAQYSDSEYEGDFGFFVFDTSAWFSNPRFQRNLPCP